MEKERVKRERDKREERQREIHSEKDIKSKRFQE